MAVNGFHISFSNGIQTKYRITENPTGKKVRVLPFETFHEKLFSVKKLPCKYSLPDQSCFFIEENADLKTEVLFDEKPVQIQSSVSRSVYLETANKIMQHIQLGDIYEMNYCFEFYAENAFINPFRVFEKLVALSKAPYSSLTKIDDLYIICCSPERFIKKTGEQIISEPMKGTAPRFSDSVKDEESKNSLKNNPKEQKENVMIVDLVRNDLSKIAKKGTVKVNELFGIKSFSTVHQMISTVSCISKTNNPDEILEALFPMGSMTGVPKKRMLELTGLYEKSARGIYSGTIGIEEPNGDFDLAVIIRSIVYDAKKNYLSFSVGSAITSDCIPEQEYEECLLKAATMTEALKI